MSANQRPTSWRKVLGPTQAAMLERLSVGPENVPGGTRNSGRDASAWTRTARALERRGLATLTYNGAGTGHTAITEFGRMVLRGTGTINYRRGVS